ncbi:hypothetical protein KJ840_02610 [Patescibacteria group bacterium]|nr:hypothetical protein [Patescibacteria group bacterium]
MSNIAKIIYVLVLLALIVKPFLIPDNPSFIPEDFFRSLTNLILILIAFLFYYFHQKDIERKEQEKKVMEKKLEVSTKKLIESFEYIGLVNRRLPLLEEITTKILSKSSDTRQAKKYIFQTLLATAVNSITKADWGLFRFVKIDEQKTMKEFSYAKNNYILLTTNITNHQLAQMRRNGGRIKKIEKLNCIYSSDYNSSVQCILILPELVKELDTELTVLQSITDQAKLFYKYFYS